MSRAIHVSISWIDHDAAGPDGTGFEARIDRRATLGPHTEGVPVTEAQMLQAVEWLVKDAVHLLAEKLLECEPATIEPAPDLTPADIGLPPPPDSLPDSLKPRSAP